MSKLRIIKGEKSNAIFLLRPLYRRHGGTPLWHLVKTYVCGDNPWESKLIRTRCGHCYYIMHEVGNLLGRVWISHTLSLPLTWVAPLKLYFQHFYGFQIKSSSTWVISLASQRETFFYFHVESSPSYALSYESIVFILSLMCMVPRFLLIDS